MLQVKPSITVLVLLQADKVESQNKGMILQST